MTAPQTQTRPEWGTAASFRCVACAEERSGIGGSILPRGWPPVVKVAVCRPCRKRMDVDKAFARRAEGNAAERARVGVHVRIADVLGVTCNELARVFKVAGTDHDAIDRELKRAPGSFGRAMETALNGDVAPLAKATDMPEALMAMMQEVARKFAPGLKVDPEHMAHWMLNHPDAEQLLAEAVHIYRQARQGTAAV